MRKYLMSGECTLGECGEVTPLYDSYGEKLYVGDLVQLSFFSDEETLNSFHGLEYVCGERSYMDDQNKERFIMGLAGEHFAYKNGELTDNIEDADWIETIVKQNHKRWRLKKCKDWTETVHGEKWGVVMTVIE